MVGVLFSALEISYDVVETLCPLDPTTAPFESLTIHPLLALLPSHCGRSLLVTNMKQRFSSLDVKVSHTLPASHTYPLTHISPSTDNRPRALNPTRLPPPRQRLRPLLAHLPPQIPPLCFRGRRLCKCRLRPPPRTTRNRLRLPCAPHFFRAHNRRRAVAFHRPSAEIPSDAKSHGRKPGGDRSHY